ncbi:hypothetical protein ZWY2020_043857 [Hordeum vulgare]|nr:hypothetical protein ZWY2020_043857 [Hordeum vulgare]
MTSPPGSSVSGRVGGRFWALANEEMDCNDEDDQPASSPTPSYLVCESILVGYFKEQVAKFIDEFVPQSDEAWKGLQDNNDDKVEVLRRVVHRRTSANAVRPWKGPLPKGESVLPPMSAVLLLQDEVGLEDFTAVAVGDTKVTEGTQINGTSMPAVRVGVAPEEVPGEVLISTVPSYPPR